MLLPLLAVTAFAAQPPETYALIVGNNSSSTQGLPALQYADDDAMKYGTLLQAFLGDDHVQIVTRLDRDTARLFPGHDPLPPTRQVLERGFAELGRKLEAAHAAGRSTAALFVFAGHGALDEGRGFLELEDGRWTAEDMERALLALPADAVHVLLDSCNSFFVLNPRSPGGRRFATAKDAAESLAKRLPRVGVFLSTSAENETYEWSELGSGIFSHLVRSGLMGGADLDGDGAITYRELQAFAAIATQDIKNPNLRPHVFARGPGGQNDAVLFAAPAAAVVRVKVLADAPTRVQLRDRDGVRWFDLLAEAKVPFSIRVPEVLAGLFEVRVDRGGERWETTLEGARGEVQLDALGRLARRGAQERGASDSLRALFQTPFGPEAVNALAAAEAARPDEVYGVSREDLGRLQSVTARIADQAHSRRLLEGVTLLSLGGLIAGLAGYTLGTGRPLSIGVGPSDDASAVGIARLQAGLFGVLSLASLIGGVIRVLLPTSPERLYQKHQAELAAGDVSAIPGIDADLQEQLEDEQGQRMASRIAGWIGLPVMTFAMGFGAYLGTRPSSSSQAAGDTLFLLGAFGFGFMIQALVQSYLEESPTEAIIRGWQQEPSRSRLNPQVGAFLTPKGGGLTLGVTF